MSRRTSFWSRKKGERLKIFSHRGNTDTSTPAYENTISAYTLAAGTGADGIEIDVNFTAEGKLICFHDATLKRISGSNKRVRESSFRTLRSIPLEGNERIPTLDEAMDAIPPSTPIIFDVKTAGFVDSELLDSFIRFIRRILMAEHREITVTSFNYMSLNYLIMKAPELRTGFLLRPDSVHTKLGMLKFLAKHYKAVHTQFSLADKRSIEVWHEQDYDVIAWTVNETVDALKLSGSDIDGIITDTPVSIMDALK
ncbi:MAG: glycerophosphodiester phosphodiesterase [Pseudomonadota bacterium]